MTQPKEIPMRPWMPEYAESHSSESDDRDDLDNNILVIGIDFGTT
jgi:hypothetical protein